MDLDEIKRDIDLRQYAKDRYEICCNSRGYAPCPFHEEREPSFEIKKYDGKWGWRDWHLSPGELGFSGTTVDFIARMEGISDQKACKKLLEEFNQGKPESKENTENNGVEKPIKTNKWNSPEIERSHIYKDFDGKPVHLKIKYRNGEWSISHWTGNKWEKGLGKHKPIPYNLDRFKESDYIIVCEGEKDTDSVNALGLGYLATSAPFGKGNFPDSLTKYFKGKKEITFLPDVGNEEDIKKHATKIGDTFPEIKIYIARVPLEKREADITDYLEQRRNDLKLKQIDFSDIMEKREEFEFRKQEIFIGSLEEFMAKSIPKNENLIDPIVFRGGLTEIGGVKGSHKSFFVNLLAFHLASCKSPFLKFTIEKPARVLLIQQEVSEGFMQERLKKMMKSEIFNTEERFYPITTTGTPLKLLKKEDFEQIKELIDKYEPDSLILDPLSSFNTSEENMSKDMSKIVSRLSELKSKYNIGLVITHHFSSKVNPNDPNAPSEAGGWFRGHTTFTDAADVLVCLHRLPGQRENPNLPKAYEDYNLVQVALRNGKWPERFAIEFDEDTFILKESDIWQEIGKKILPGQIEELIEANGGEMFQKDVIGYFKSKARPTTVKYAIKEAILQGAIEKENLSGRGNPVLLRLKK